MENNNIYPQGSLGLVELERSVSCFKTRMTTLRSLSRTSTPSRSKKTTNLVRFLPPYGPLTLTLGTMVKCATPLEEKTQMLSWWIRSQVPSALHWRHTIQCPPNLSTFHPHQSVWWPNHCSFCHTWCRRAFLCNTPLTDSPCSRWTDSCVVSGQGGEGWIQANNHGRGPRTRCPAVWLRGPKNTASGCKRQSASHHQHSSSPLCARPSLLFYQRISFSFELHTSFSKL